MHPVRVAGQGSAGGSGGVPGPGRPVAAGGGDPGAVRGDRDGGHLAVVAGEGGAGGAGGVPGPGRLVVAGGGDPGAVRADRHSRHPAAVAGDGGAGVPPASHLVRHVLAAGEWVRALLERAAPSATWLDYVRWTAETPFTTPAAVPSMIAVMPPGPGWAPCRDAAATAWQNAVALLGERFAGIAQDGPAAYAAFLASSDDQDEEPRLRREAVATVRAFLDGFRARYR